MSEYINLSAFIAGRPVVDPNTGAPTAEYLLQLNNTLRNIRVAINQLATQAADIEASLLQAGIALTTAQTVQEDLETSIAEGHLINSYTVPATILAASDAGDNTITITISDHNRVYGDETTVAVTGGTLTGLLPSTRYYVFYDDPDWQGGTVVYSTCDCPDMGGQGNGQHAVGDILTPAIGGATTGGGGVTPRGTRYYNDGSEIP